MSKIQVRLNELKFELHGKHSELRRAEQQYYSSEEDIRYSEENLQSQLEVEKEEYIEQKQEEIKGEYEPKIDELESKISETKDLLNIKEVDDTEELVEAKDRREYLNTAAGLLNTYYIELKKVSSAYFIDLAYNEKKLSMKAFTKAFKTIPKRITELKNLRENLYLPFSKVESNAETKGVNFSYYLWSTVGSPMVAITAPIAFFKSLNRAKYLHESAELYHKMMHSLISLKDKTDQEVNDIFRNLLTLRNQRIIESIEAKEKELEELHKKLEHDLDQITFNEEGFMRNQSFVIAGKKNALASAETLIEKLKEEIEELEAEIRSLSGERSVALQVEREYYLNSNEERSVQLPNKILYDYNSEHNAICDLKEGLYLYTEREVVGSFIQLVTFQLRNIMEWGAIQFKVLDLLGGEFVAPLMLPMSDKANAQDITISTLRDEREKTIELMHDLFRRRRTQILSVADNIGDYNLIQKSTGSSPMAYQIIFIVLDDAIKVEEKLTQLIYNGDKLGLLVFVFMKHEFLTVQLAKSIETFFPSFIELSDTGVTFYDPVEYREQLEVAESERKKGI